MVNLVTFFMNRTVHTLLSKGGIPIDRIPPLDSQLWYITVCAIGILLAMVRYSVHKTESKIPVIKAKNHNNLLRIPFPFNHPGLLFLLMTILDCSWLCLVLVSIVYDSW